MESPSAERPHRFGFDSDQGFLFVECSPEWVKAHPTEAAEILEYLSVQLDQSNKRHQETLALWKELG